MYACIWLHLVLVVAGRIFVMSCGIFHCGMWDLSLQRTDSLVMAQELQSTQTSVAATHRLSCSTACGILVWQVGSQLPNQGSNPCPCPGRQILNHWTTREVSSALLKDSFAGYRILDLMCFFSTLQIFHTTLFLHVWFLRRSQIILILIFAPL